MKQKIRWITETAVMLALLVALQAITKPLGQLVTGSCVNAILAIAVLVGGMSCGITVALMSAAGVKFAVLYLLVVQLICGVASDSLLGKKLGQVVLLAPPMLQALPTMFAWPQLLTALIGGGIALVTVPMLRKALKK